MRRGRSEPTFLCPVGSIRIFREFEVEFDLVETFFTHKIFAFGTEVSSVDYGVYIFVRVRLEVSSSLDTPDALEAEGIPDAA